MEKVSVKFCISNLVSGSLSIYEQLNEEKQIHIQLKPESCIGYCSRCSDTLFALVEREKIEADDPDELYKKIIYFISRQLK